MTTCPGCGAGVQPDFAFCPRCGGPLPRGCPSCGAACPPDFAFCPRCGARLRDAPAAEAPRPARDLAEAPSGARPGAARGDAPADEGDRRLVTVLFADVSGFTALSERLDPEEVRAFQSDLFREMSAALERYEGFAEKFVGDAVMAVFGAPRAHEDDPERALHAALAMHERAAALGRRWAARLGRAPALHIGVNTGPVVAGTLGSAATGAYAVTGDTVNTAARLQAAAEPGQTLVSDLTYQLAQHAFAFEALGELAVKGRRQPVPVYRLTGRRGTHGPVRGLEAHGLMAPMVGRAEELGQLLAAYDRMRRGRAQVVSLVGEAGVGKSRLLREWLAALEADGRLAATIVRRAVCSGLGEQPYGVFATFFRDAYGVGAHDPLVVAQDRLASGLAALGADASEPAAIAPLLGFVLGIEPAERFRHVEPEQLKRQIFLALRRLVERRLQQGPLLLVVENLQWADAVSVEALQFIVDRLAGQPLMLVVTYRPPFDPRGLAGARATHTALRLGPLSPEDSEALLGAWFGHPAGCPPHLRRLVLDRAGGHPLFLEEIVRSLIARGLLVREGEGWACVAEAAGVDVPPTIQALLLARVDRLPAEVRRVLQEAAMLGLTFELPLLRRLVDGAATLEAALEALQDADVLEEVPGPSDAGPDRRIYRFRHALVQEVVYQSMLVRRRTESHARAGRALEALVGGQPARLEDVEALGHHFSLSDEPLKGAQYLVAAGDWARRMYANDDAARHYERALATLAGCDACGNLQWAVRERLGDLLAPVGRRDAALAHYEAALAAHTAAGNAPGQARLQRKLARLAWDAGDRANALARLTAGLDLLEGHAEHIELAHLYQEMGRLAFRSGDHRQAIDWAERALAQAERLSAAAAAGGDAPEPDDRDAAASAVAQAYNTLGVALARTGRLEEAAGYIERSIAVAEAHDLLQAACRGYTNLGVLYSTLDPSRAIETCLHGLDTARQIGDLGLQSRLNTNLAVAYCALTNRCEEQGLAAAHAALDLDRQLGQLDHLAVPLIVLGQIQQCHGDAALARQYYEEALALVEPTGEPQLLFPCYDGLATLHLDRGDEARAEEFMRKAQQVCERAGLDPDSFVVLPFLE